MRIALIHALRHSPPPIEAAFREHWPEARLMNLLDDSLSADLARDGKLTEAMTQRFLTLARYAAGAGAQAVLFSCSAFGPCIEACAQDLAPLPVLKPNEAAIEEAVGIACGRPRPQAEGRESPAQQRGRKVGLLATFPATLASMPAEFPPGVELVPCLAKGALAALDAGDLAAHDRLAAEASVALKGCDVVLLGQFSLARAAAAVEAATGRPVVTTPGSAVRKLRRALGA
jgi:Asp/Glu/hydantoin racemase